MSPRSPKAPRDEFARLDADEEFFVGYLDTPPRTKRLALGAGVLALAVASAVAAAAAAFQRHPGRALRPVDWSAEIAGIFVQEPYPHLRFVDEAGQLQTALSARGDKAGLGDAFADLDGEEVTFRGALFVRGEGHLLVIFRAPEASATLDETTRARLRAVETEALGEVSLHGELVDAKCFFGQMRPGEGRAHRACAQLCVRGGIAPVFVTTDGEGEETQYLLVDEHGGAAQEMVIPYLAEHVRVEGALERRGDLIVLRATSLTRM